MSQKSSKNLCQLVAGNIKAERLRLGLTQEKLAAMTGLSVRFISRLEGEPQNLRLENLEKFATAFAIDPIELMRDSDCSAFGPTVAEQFKSAMNTMHSIYERCFNGHVLEGAT